MLPPLVLLLPLLALLVTLLCFFAWAVHSTTYWRRNSMPYVPALPFIGNLKKIATFQMGVGEVLQELYESAEGQNRAAVGFHMFHQPALLLRDLELIRRVLVKDFASFNSRYSQADHVADKVGGSTLFHLPHREWRAMRAKLTPFFTSAKLRNMFYIVKDIGVTFDRSLSELVGTSGLVDVRDRMARFTIDVVAACAFGVNANSLLDEKSQFRYYGRKMFDFTYRRGVELTSIFLLPILVPIFRFKLFTKESSYFLRSTLTNVMAERERDGVKRNDLIDTLLELKNAGRKESSEMVFEGDVLVAQAAFFFTAGFETSASTMLFGLYELARQPTLQDKLRAEIRETLRECNGDLNYETLNKMPYLDQVFMETLRMYPILPFVDRKCTSDEGYSLEPFAKFTIPKGMPVTIPVYALQRDPQYFPDPDTFDPERFSAENRGKVVPYTYMPFGAGQHNCIGERFAAIQSKLGLVSFLRNHRVEPSAKTPCVGKMDYLKTSLFLQPAGDMFLSVSRDPLY